MGLLSVLAKGKLFVVFVSEQSQELCTTSLYGFEQVINALEAFKMLWQCVPNMLGQFVHELIISVCIEV